MEVVCIDNENKESILKKGQIYSFMFDEDLNYIKIIHPQVGHIDMYYHRF